jgi:hypothetical protein
MFSPPQILGVSRNSSYLKRFEVLGGQLKVFNFTWIFRSFFIHTFPFRAVFRSWWEMLKL